MRPNPFSPLCLTLALASAAVLLGGCFSAGDMFKPEKDHTRFYVLSSATRAAPAPAAGAPVVQLHEAEVARYLRDRSMVVRRGDNQIEFREYSRWGEPIELGLTRVLREELIARGAFGGVVSPGLRAAAAAPELELRVRVLAAEGGEGGAVVFRAAWELATTAVKREIVARGDFQPAGLRWDGKNEAQIAARISEAIAGLAAEVSAAVKK